MNLLIFSSDNHDSRILQSLGYPGALTPHMDRLSASGTTFSRTYCSSPQCVPSRASMWSGKQVHQIPAWNNYTGLSPQDPTFLSHLEAAGLKCACFGKTDYLGGHHDEQNRLAAWIRSLDLGLVEKLGPRFFLDDDRSPRSQQMLRHWGKVDEDCRWLEDQQDDSPFCCYVGVNPPHPGGGYHTNRHWFDQIDPEAMHHPPHHPSDHPTMVAMRRAKGAEKSFSQKQIVDMRRAYLVDPE